MHNFHVLYLSSLELVILPKLLVSRIIGRIKGIFWAHSSKVYCKPFYVVSSSQCGATAERTARGRKVPGLKLACAEWGFPNN